MEQNRESSTSRQKTLPEAWVARIFSELQGNYGSRFLNMWKVGQTLADGTDAGLANAKRVWAEKLAGFTANPEAIKRALETLPTDPPTLPQFVEMCRQAPRKEPLALPHHLTPEEIQRNKQRVAEMVQQLVKSKSKGDGQ